MLMGPTKDVAQATPLLATQQADPPLHPVRKWLLSVGGVKMSQDGKCVFNYNPGKLTAGVNFLAVLSAIPSMFNVWFYVQYALVLCILAFSRLVCFGLREEDQKQMLYTISEQNEILAGLTRFVLGLYVSLVLAKTYYANRTFFGTVFGSTMGFCQMVAAWVRPPDDRSEACRCALAAQALLVRWVNAAYRLLVLEVRNDPGYLPEEIGGELLRRGLLTEREWKCIANIPSRASHIYQWVNNVLLDLVRAGYIQDTKLLELMHTQVDQMRAANVWGLPSLPLPYTLIITVMVKYHLFNQALEAGVEFHSEDAKRSTAISIALWLMLQHFLYQGLLDLHGALYNPNGGEYLGHMPAENFLDFVQNVTTDMIHVSGCNTEETLPYKLDLARERVIEREESEMWQMLGAS